jgi:hypothetical protein
VTRRGGTASEIGRVELYILLRKMKRKGRRFERVEFSEAVLLKGRVEDIFLQLRVAW